MQLDELQEIVDRYRGRRVLFHYYRDRFALLLLEQIVGQGCTIGQLKATPFRSLLNRPVVKSVLARRGDGTLLPEDLRNVWANPTDAYRLTWGAWPVEREAWSRSWHQMARPGHNLVLQLNLPMSHVRAAEQLLKTEREQLRQSCHPIARGRELTLAWARVDLDYDRGEALIEEIQSDWVRDVVNAVNSNQHHDGWRAYLHRHLRPHVRSWSEVMLAATIWFLRHELHVKRLFYYTFETGNRLKELSPPLPPRSLYTDLPQRFCFQRTYNGPLFLRDGKLRRLRRTMRDPSLTWFVLLM